jgi:hypothetical protein
MRLTWGFLSVPITCISCYVYIVMANEGQLIVCVVIHREERELCDWGLGLNLRLNIEGLKNSPLTLSLAAIKKSIEWRL